LRVVDLFEFINIGYKVRLVNILIVYAYFIVKNVCDILLLYINLLTFSYGASYCLRNSTCAFSR